MNWIIENPTTMWSLTLTHIWLSFVPVLISVILALPIGMLVSKAVWLRKFSVSAASIIFTIPSLALFVTLPGLIGTQILDPLNVVIALTLYATALLVRVIPEALDAVPADVSDAAVAVGHAPLRRIMTVDLPLALPVLFANLRVIAVTNASLVSVGAVIGIGGLGQLFTSGFQRNYPDQILAGIIGILVLALVMDLGLLLLSRAVTPWTRSAPKTLGVSNAFKGANAFKRAGASEAVDR